MQIERLRAFGIPTLDDAAAVMLSGWLQGPSPIADGVNVQCLGRRSGEANAVLYSNFIDILNQGQARLYIYIYIIVIYIYIHIIWLYCRFEGIKTHRDECVDLL